MASDILKWPRRPYILNLLREDIPSCASHLSPVWVVFQQAPQILLAKAKAKKADLTFSNKAYYFAQT
jgi:hypothetical protein